jgi:hypothetical protein
MCTYHQLEDEYSREKKSRTGHESINYWSLYIIPSSTMIPLEMNIINYSPLFSYLFSVRISPLLANESFSDIKKIK